MMRHTITSILAGLALVGGMVAAVAAPSSTIAGPARGGGGIVGDWYNLNPGTRSITRIDIAATPGTMQAENYGACVPSACDWGSAAVAANVGGTAGTDEYIFSFAQKYQAIKRIGSELRVRTFTHFTDGSGRADYTSYDYFYKAPSFFPGVYVNIDPATRGLTRIVLGLNADGSYSVRPFGSCLPSDCDWGTTNTSFNSSPAAVATFDFSFKISTVSLTNDGAYLQATVLNHFTDGSNRDYTAVYDFRLPTGQWVNIDPATRDITRVIVSQASDGSLIAHAYGACSPTDCDWGSMPMVLSGDHYTASYSFGFADSTLVLTPGDSSMKVEDLTHFTDGSGRADLDLMNTMSIS